MPPKKVVASKAGPKASAAKPRAGGSKTSTARPAKNRDGKTVDAKAAQAQVKKYRKRADRYREDPAAANRLLDEALGKGDAKNRGPLAEIWDSLQTLIRMVRAYFDGSYEAVPWETIALAIVAVAYFVMPFDLVPDFIPVAGLIDDAAVIALVIASIDDDLREFEGWERKRAEAARRRKSRAKTAAKGTQAAKGSTAKKPTAAPKKSGAKVSVTKKAPGSKSTSRRAS